MLHSDLLDSLSPISIQEWREEKIDGEKSPSRRIGMYVQGKSEVGKRQSLGMLYYGGG